MDCDRCGDQRGGRAGICEATSDAVTPNYLTERHTTQPLLDI